MNTRKSKATSTALPTQALRKPRRRILATSAAALLGAGLYLMGSGQAQAQALAFDTNLAAPGVGGAGLWNTGVGAAALWNATYPAGTGAPVVWNNAGTTAAIFDFTAGGNAPGAVVVSNAGGQVLVGNIDFGATGYTVSGGPLVIAGTSTINLGTSGTAPAGVGSGTVDIISAALQDTGAGGGGINVVSTGATPGTLTLSATNAINGPINVSSGNVVLSALRAASGNSLTIGDGMVADTASVTTTVTGAIGVASTGVFNTPVLINSNGTLFVGTTVATLQTLGSIASGTTGPLLSTPGSGLGTINLGTSAAVASIIQTGTDNTNTTFNGNITGNGSILKVGTGTWTLTSSSNFIQPVGPGFGVQIGTGLIAGGAILITNGNALGAATNTVDVNFGNTFTSGSLILSGGITTAAYATQLNGAGTGSFVGNQDGALVNAAGINNYAGAITLGSASTIASDAGTLNLTSTTALAGGFVLTLNASTADLGSGSIAGALNALTGLTVNGSGGVGGSVWTLNGPTATTAAGVWAAPVTINSGTLKGGVANALGTSGVKLQLNVAPGSPGIFDLGGNNQIVGTLNGVAGSMITSNGPGNAVLTINGVGSVAGSAGTFSGNIVAGGAGSGTLGLNIMVGAANTFTLDGTVANTYTGLTTVTTGALIVTNSSAPSAVGAFGALGTSTGAADGTVVTGGAMLQLNTAAAVVPGVNIGNETLLLNGTGTGLLGGVAVPGGTGALFSAGGVNVANGPIILQSASTIAVGPAAGNMLTVGVPGTANNVSSTGGAFVLTLNNDNATGNGAAASVFNLVISSSVSGLTVNSGGAANSGTWVLAGASTYAGPTMILGGTAKAGIDTVGGAAPTSGAFGINSDVTVTAPGTMDVNGHVTTIGSLTGTGKVTNSAGATALTLGNTDPTTLAGLAAKGNFIGIINDVPGGQLTLNKVGATIQELSGANAYNGDTNIMAGIILANNATALGMGTAAPVGSASLVNLINVSSGASLVLAGGATAGTSTTIGSAATPYTLDIVGTGNPVLGAPGALTLTAGTFATFNGSIYVDPTHVQPGVPGATISTNGAGTLNLGAAGGAIAGQFINKANSTLVLTGGGTINVNETINSVGATAVFNSDLVVDSVTTNETVANSYVGNTFIRSTTSAGTLNATVSGALPNSGLADTTQRTTITMGDGTSSAAFTTALNLSTGTVNAVQSLTSAGATGLQATITMLGTSVFTVGNTGGAGGNTSFNGVIAGTGTLQKDASSTQTLAGINTYTGATNVINGILNAGIAENVPGAAGVTGAFGNHSAVTVGNPATVAGLPAPTLQLSGFNETIGSLAGIAAAGGIVQNNGIPAATLTISAPLGAPFTATNYAGVIRDGAIVGTGSLSILLSANNVLSQTQTFSGLNTYTGTTTVTKGTLQAGISENITNTAGAFGFNSAVTVNGGTLDLAGNTANIGFLSDGGAVVAGSTVTNSTPLVGGTLNILTKTNAAPITATTTRYGGLISGNLALSIGDPAGAPQGTQSISSGANTYTGGTTVLTGATLDIDASDSGVAGQGTLGTGTLTINKAVGAPGAIIGTGSAAGVDNIINNAVTVNDSFTVTNAPLTAAPGFPVVAGAPVINVFNPNVAGSGGFISAGVTFAGPVNLASAGVTTINTTSGFLDLTGVVSGSSAAGGLAFTGRTFSFIAGAASNTYAGTTTVGDAAAAAAPGVFNNYLLLGKTGGAVAIPGNLVITPNGYVEFNAAVAVPAVTNNQIATNANVLVNGTLDTAGLSQAINALTGSGVVRLDATAYNIVIGGALVQGGTLTVNSGLFSGNITGVNGQLVKNSTGTLILTGANGLTGKTTINAGILQVDGSIASANTQVNPAGTLQGIGVIGGNVANNGLVKPGDAGPGTLTVKGNYAQSAGGNLRIDLASTTNYGRLAVGGKASLNGTLTAVSDNGFTPKPGNVFTILTAGGGVSGTFATFNNQTGAPTSGLLRLQVIYDPNDVKLEFNQQSFVSTLNGLNGPNGLNGLTFNETAVARNLDENINNPRLGKIISYLDRLPINSVFNALDEIAPEEISAIYTTQVSLANVQSINLIRRMDDIHAGSSGFSAQGFHMAGSGPLYSGNMGLNSDDGKDVKETKQVAPPEEPKLGVFITGDGEWVSVGNGDPNARGFDLESGGFTLGIDYKITPTFAVGVDAGYAHTNGNLVGGGRLDVDGGKLGLYATLFPGDFYLDAAVNGGFNSYGIKRAGLAGTAFSDADGGDLNTLVGAGYMFHAGGLTVGPTGTFQYTYMGIKHYTEHGSLAPLDFPGQNTDSLRTAFGGKASYDWKAGGIVIRPEVSVAWQHEYAETAYGIDSSFAGAGTNTFTVRGPNVGRDSLLVGAGVAVQLSDRFSTYVYYDGQFARTNLNNDSTVSGGFRLSF